MARRAMTNFPFATRSGSIGGMDGDAFAATSLVTFDTGANGIDGGIAAVCPDNAAAQYVSCGLSTLGITDRNLCFAVRLRPTASPTATKGLIQIVEGANVPILVQITTARKLRVLDANSTQIGSDTTQVLSTTDPTLIELVVNFPASGNGTAELWIDGVLAWNSASIDVNNTVPDNSRFGRITSTAASYDIHIYSIRINDGTGADNTGRVGHRSRMAYRKGTADFARGANWLGGSGGTSNLFGALDNTPPVGVAVGASSTDSTQIENAASDTTGNYDMTVQSCADVGIGAADKIELLQAVAAVGASSLTNNPTGEIGVIANPDDGAEDTFGAYGVTAGAGTYPTNWKGVRGHLIVDPTVDIAATSRVRIGKRTATTTVATVCALGIIVEYTPALAAGQASETDSAQAVTHRKAKAVGQTTTTSTSQPVTAKKTKAAGQPSETDTAQAVRPIKSRVLGQAADTETAPAVAHRKTKAVGQSSTTETAQPIAHAKTRSIGQATETSVAQPITRANPVIAAGQTSETDTAGTLSVHKTQLAGRPSETDTAEPIAHTKRQTIGQTAEVDAAQAGSIHKTTTLVATAETDTARPITVRKTLIVGQSADTSEAQPITTRKAKTLGACSETGQAQPLIATRTITVAAADEPDVATPISSTKQHTLGQAAETSAAHGIAAQRAHRLGQPAESDGSQNLTAPGTLGLTNDGETAQPIEHARGRVVGQAVETSTAPAVTSRVTIQTGRATETATARPVLGARSRVVGRALELDSVGLMQPIRTLRGLTGSRAGSLISGRPGEIATGHSGGRPDGRPGERE